MLHSYWDFLAKSIALQSSPLTSLEFKSHQLFLTHDNALKIPKLKGVCQCVLEVQINYTKYFYFIHCSFKYM